MAAAAQRGGDRAGGDEEQRGEWETRYIWQVSGECCGNVERTEPRKHDEGNCAHYADRACVGGEEGEAEEVDARQDRHLPP
eukprot:scaffold2459_cov72-Phaeocystis_antarctica.AAC.4